MLLCSSVSVTSTPSQKSFYKNSFVFADDKDSKKSQKVLAELENIDDECDQNDIAFVKIDDDNEAHEWGIEELPTMVLFERGIPHIYEGDLMQEEELLGWLIHQKKHTEIPEVTDEMKDKLIETFPHVAVIFCEFCLTNLIIVCFLRLFSFY